MSHICHWPNCIKEVPPAMWGCKEHWFKLQKYLRDKIWNSYIHGQEIRKDPSPEYVAVAKEVQLWILENYGGML